jgi:hypothetical protein
MRKEPADARFFPHVVAPRQYCGLAIMPAMCVLIKRDAFEERA